LRHHPRDQFLFLLSESVNLLLFHDQKTLLIHQKVGYLFGIITLINSHSIDDAGRESAALEISRILDPSQQFHSCLSFLFAIFESDRLSLDLAVAPGILCSGRFFLVTLNLRVLYI